VKQFRKFLSRTKDILRVRTVVVLAIVSLLGYGCEKYEDQLPWLIRSQLEVHAWLSNLDWRHPRADQVVLIEIDDNTHWGPLLGGGTIPTDREFLAKLGMAAAEGGAAVVAIDVQLRSRSDQPGDDPNRRDQNGRLLGAVRDITRRGVPVVLTVGLVPDDGEWRREPNIFDDSQLPENVSLGFINLPVDKRQIPLEARARDWDRKSDRDFDSFALQIVCAYERVRQNTCVKERQPLSTYENGF